jgi:hypothetical protein
MCTSFLIASNFTKLQKTRICKMVAKMTALFLLCSTHDRASVLCEVT